MCIALEKEMATHSSILAWRIPGTEEPGGLPSMGLHRVGHDWRDLAAAAACLVNLWDPHHRPHPGSATCNQWGTCNSQLLCEEQKIWIQYVAPQLLKLSLEGLAPQTPSSKSQKGLCLWDPPDSQFSRSVVFNALQPHGLQHARLPWPSPTPGAYSNSCTSSWSCHQTLANIDIVLNELTRTPCGYSSRAQPTVSWQKHLLFFLPKRPICIW